MGKEKKNLGYEFKKRTIKEMLSGKIDVIYDFTELDRQLEDKEITYEEWSKEFSRLRHIYPCTIGGSSVGALLGNSEYKTPSALQKEIKFPMLDKKRVSKKKHHIFARGHMYESSIANLGCLFLEERLKEQGLCESVTVKPFKTQIRNMAFPHCVADCDCLVEIKGGPYEGSWLGEVKTASKESKAWKNYFSKEDLPDIERIPRGYLNQMDFYLGVAPLLRGGIMFASCGYDENDHVQLMFERDDNRSLLVLNTAEEFCVKTVAGVKADDDCVESINAFNASLVESKGKLDSSVPLADISGGKYLEEIASLDNEINELSSKLKEFKEYFDGLYEEQAGEDTQKLEYLKKQQELLINKSVHLLGDASKGSAVLSDGSTLTLEVVPSISWNAEVKNLLKTEYPEAYEECIKLGLKYSKKLDIQAAEEGEAIVFPFANGDEYF